MTKFNIGEKVYILVKNHLNMTAEIHGPYTIGHVRVEHTDSPGIAGEEVFDNFKAQKEHKEQYMCIETGIGSGSLWSHDQLFKNFDSALSHKQYFESNHE
jgi:hypothetical protein